MRFLSVHLVSWGALVAVSCQCSQSEVFDPHFSDIGLRRAVTFQKWWSDIHTRFMLRLASRAEERKEPASALFFFILDKAVLSEQHYECLSGETVPKSMSIFKQYCIYSLSMTAGFKCGRSEQLLSLISDIDRQRIVWNTYCKKYAGSDELVLAVVSWSRLAHHSVCPEATST